jgi:hypothetical protein
LSLEELVAKAHQLLVVMASVSASADVPGHIYTSINPSKRMLAGWLHHTNQASPAPYQGAAGETAGRNPVVV